MFGPVPALALALALALRHGLALGFDAGCWTVAIVVVGLPLSVVVDVKPSSCRGQETGEGTSSVRRHLEEQQKPDSASLGVYGGHWNRRHSWSLTTKHRSLLEQRQGQGLYFLTRSYSLWTKIQKTTAKAKAGKETKRRSRIQKQLLPKKKS